MHRSWRRSVVAAVAVGAVGLSIWLWAKTGESLGVVNALWGVIAGIVALIVALVPWASKMASTSIVESTTNATLDHLATAVELQWRDEAEIRGLFRPLPLPVRWSAANPELSDRLVNILVSEMNISAIKNTNRDFLNGSLPGIADAFGRIPSRRLVVIGEPGTGKTVLLLLLTLELLARRKANEPVPVLFPLASWNPSEQHINTWMAEWLEETYTWLRTPTSLPNTTLAMWLVKTKRVIPLLDGLDEMAEDLRSAAISSLNQAMAPSAATATDPLVLACRAKEYAELVTTATKSAQIPVPDEVLAEPLASAAVVELRPLEVTDVKAYLIDATPEQRANKWNTVIAELDDRPKGQLAQALSTPLTTTMARIAYSATSKDPSELLGSTLTNRIIIEKYLLDQLIPSVYSETLTPSNARWGAEKAFAWLQFLARHLEQQRTRDLAWWEFGRRVPRLLYWIIFGIITGTVSAIAFLILAGPEAAIIIGGGTFAVAPAIALIIEVSPPCVVKIRLKASIPRFTLGFAIGLVVGIILELLLELPLGSAVAVGAAVGGAGGLASGLEFLLEQPVDTRKAINPRSLLVSDRTTLLIRVLGIGPCGGLAVSLAIGLKSGLGLERGSRVGIVVALAAGLGVSVVVSLRTRALIGISVGIFLGVLAGVILGFTLSRSGASDIVLAVTCGIWLWLEISLALTFTSAWGAYIIGQIRPVLLGRLPWCLLAFLDDAHRRGVLRQNGAIYQFRHSALQDRLAGGEESSVSGTSKLD